MGAQDCNSFKKENMTKEQRILMGNEAIGRGLVVISPLF